ncbi:MAG TPA: ABC transporter permease subunit [Actinomycetales bacterium]|nr:ABC transporter permease subunit [Actinomycetales bacterium]
MAGGTVSPVRGVLALELTQRIRSTRWRVLLGVWFVVLVASVVLQYVFFRSVGRGMGRDPGAWDQASTEAIVHGTLLFVLLVGLIIAPAQSATSINGDSRDGVLALVQAAPVSTRAVLMGKLLAAWIASLAFLVVSLPVLAWAVITGGIAWWAMLLGVLVVSLLLLAISAMGLGLSAVTVRPGSSTMLSYLVVAVLVIGLPVVFLLAAPMLEQREVRPVAQLIRYDVDHTHTDPDIWCEVHTTEWSSSDSRVLSWLFLPNPVVILADALPHAAESVGPMPVIRNLVDSTFRAPQEPPATCEELAARMSDPDYGANMWAAPTGDSGSTGWKWLPGLGINLLLGGLGIAAAHRRLKVPAGELPRGVRIA